jgi:hypothetical protein
MEQKTIRDCGIITIVFLLASLVFYGYFVWMTPGGMTTIYRNWDGPAYAIVAKSLYNPDIIENINTLAPDITRPSYFTQEYPLYPIFIRMFSALGYNEAMIVVSQMFSLLFILLCYFLFKHVQPESNALVLCLLLIFYLPRWFIVSKVGSSEPVYMFFATLSMYLYLKQKTVPSALSGALAVLTRLSGIFYFIGIAVFMVVRRLHPKRFMPYLLMPLTLVLIFVFYGSVFGNIMISIDEYAKHPITQWPPFRNFTNLEYYHDIWKEGQLLLHLLYAIAISVLISRKQYFLAITALPYFAYLFFVHHADMSRYLLPLMPLLFIAFEKQLSTKSVYIPMFLFVPIIYLIAISFVEYNLAPATALVPVLLPQ